MKIIKLHAICMIASIAMIVSSCEDNLKETIYGTLADNSFWKTEKDISEGLNGAYSLLNEPWAGYSLFPFFIEDCCSDICFSASNQWQETIFKFTGWNSTTPSDIGSLYQNFYTLIARVNKTIDMIPGSEMTEEKKLQYTNEGRALRAAAYFALVQWFGDVPLVTSSKEVLYSIPQQPAEKIYAFIETELNEVYSTLPTREQYVADGMTDYGRLTRAAALGMLARTYLVQTKYTECANVCSMIINKQNENGAYSLMPDFPKIFTETGDKNTEMIWALPGNGVSNGMHLQIYLWKGGNSALPEWKDAYQNWSGATSLTADFYNSFEANDQRRKCMYFNLAASSERAMINKYQPVTSDKVFSATDFPMVRYADVLLMYAESFLLGGNDLANAVKYVNEVRQRAGATPYNAGDYTVASFKSKLIQERKMELFFEACGKRDMLRLEKENLINLIKERSSDAGDFPEKYLLLPFSSTALAANPALIQNPGYR